MGLKLKLTTTQQRKLNEDLNRVAAINSTIGVLCASFANQIPLETFCAFIQDAQRDLELQFFLHAEITLEKLILKMSS